MDGTKGEQVGNLKSAIYTPWLMEILQVNNKVERDEIE